DCRGPLRSPPPRSFPMPPRANTRTVRWTARTPAPAGVHRRVRSVRPSDLDKPLENLRTVLGKKAFGMKLQSDQRISPMADAHHLPLTVGRVAPGRDDEIRMNRVGLDHQAVIARRDERIRQALKKPLIVVKDPIRF